MVTPLCHYNHLNQILFEKKIFRTFAVTRVLSCLLLNTWGGHVLSTNYSWGLFHLLVLFRWRTSHGDASLAPPSDEIWNFVDIPLLIFSRFAPACNQLQSLGTSNYCRGTHLVKSRGVLERSLSRIAFSYFVFTSNYCKLAGFKQPSEVLLCYYYGLWAPIGKKNAKLLAILQLIFWLSISESG